MRLTPRFVWSPGGGAGQLPICVAEGTRGAQCTHTRTRTSRPVRPHDRTVLARGESSAPHRRARPSTLRAPSTAPHRRPRRSTAHIDFSFSALTIPLPRFPPRSRPPDARAHPPRPMSAFSARVNIAPSESPARECPDGPSPSARPDPPLKRDITPPSPQSLVCWRGECVIDDPRVRLHRDSTFFSFSIGELGRRHNTRRRRRRPSSIRLSRGRSIVSKTHRRRSRTPRTTGRRDRHRSLGLSDFHGTSR